MRTSEMRTMTIKSRAAAFFAIAAGLAVWTMLAGGWQAARALIAAACVSWN